MTAHGNVDGHAAPLLHDGLERAAHAMPGNTALVEPGGSSLDYRTLDAYANGLAARLKSLGVTTGDRVGLLIPKTIDSVIAVMGVLKTGAAYVPVDPQSPAERAAFIFSDCAVKVLIAYAPLLPDVQRALAALNVSPAIVDLASVGGGTGIAPWVAPAHDDDTAQGERPSVNDPAYILYTSGSTGRPKGVVVSHRAAVAFVEWGSDTFRPSADDRFSSHAPFHFDLSIFDLFVAQRHGAAVVLIGEELGKEPHRLAQVIQDEHITIWYSTPSILSMLDEFGRLERYTHDIRYVLFAGEVFPMPKLRRLMSRWTTPRYFDLFGPTETNVCTWFEVPNPLPDAMTTLPIGWVCDHYTSRIVQDGVDVVRGERGELLIAGAGLMTGYWNLPERNAGAFHVDDHGERWYRTGDIVSVRPDGALEFHGRRDRMVKRRGYRIELGEIEAGLIVHPAIQAVATAAFPDESSGVSIVAFVVTPDARPSIIELKAFCTSALPKYMAPDRFVFVSAIPQTSTGKTDYQALAAHRQG